MPKGQVGCFRCGEPTDGWVVQIWLRDYTDDGRTRTVDSVVRAFCADCAWEVYTHASTVIRRRVSAYLGCGYCGERSICRIQVWMRHRGRSELSTTKSFCEECSLIAYGDACAPLSEPEPTLSEDRQP